MAARYTVYCKRSVAEVTPEQLLAGAQIADLHTIAENDDVPEEVIISALRQLRIENVDGAGFRFYRFCYRPADDSWWELGSQYHEYQPLRP